jgi:(2R)-3-sulfolactate dehydrogenase (NADP+)
MDGAFMSSVFIKAMASPHYGNLTYDGSHNKHMKLNPDQALQLARTSILAAGASEAVAHSLAEATVAAELWGRPSVGFTHLFDYLNALRVGRISPNAEPVVDHPVPAAVRVDACHGIAQLGFDRSFDDLVERAQRFGIAAFIQRNSYTAGELGYYTRRLAANGLVALAASNGPALVATGSARQAVFGTNPFSFAAPVRDSQPLLIDQATSATAFVNIRAAAEKGEHIPAGWVLDAQGIPVTDAAQALHGLLQTFGGSRGANVSLMVEVLAAGLTGAQWSIDAPSFTDGERSPAVGLLVVTMTPQLLADDFEVRMATHLERLTALGVHIPGRRPARQHIDLPDATITALKTTA